MGRDDRRDELDADLGPCCDRPLCCWDGCTDCCAPSQPGEAGSEDALPRKSRVSYFVRQAMSRTFLATKDREF